MMDKDLIDSSTDYIKALELMIIQCGRRITNENLVTERDLAGLKGKYLACKSLYNLQAQKSPTPKGKA